MGEATKIQWAHDTFNIAWGCTKISEGCKGCYAEAWAKRWGLPIWGQDAPRRMMSDTYWRQPVRWDREAAASRKPRYVFCSSMADVAEDHPELVEPRRRLVNLIGHTPFLTWLLLTKRPERMVDLFAQAGWTGVWPDNVWAGTTCENQERADQRIPHLLQVPAKVRFLSCEPLLGPLDLRRYLWLHGPSSAGPWHDVLGRRRGGGGKGGQTLSQVPSNDIHWIITGGESGPRSRPFDLAWARDLRDQCQEAEVAFFFKQLGANPVDLVLPRGSKGDDMDLFPLDLRIQAHPGVEKITAHP